MIQAFFKLKKGDFHLHVDLELPGRGLIALSGPSTAGKTTLLRLLAGLEYEPGGRLLFQDRVWQDQNRFLPPQKRRTGFVFQEGALFSHLSVRSNLLYGYRRLSVEKRVVHPEKIIALLSLEPLLARRIQALSGGERRRVLLGRALLSSPALLLLDEPFTGLDPESRDAILTATRQVCLEYSIPAILVSHSMEEVAALCEYIVMMRSGRIEASGPLFSVVNSFSNPQATGPEAEALLEGIVLDHDDQFQLTRVVLAGSEIQLLVGRLPLLPNQRVVLRAQARDVSLTLKKPEHSSILNILPARVAALAEKGSSGTGQLTVQLDLGGGHRLFSRITLRSACELSLKEGLEIFAQIKGVAILS